MLVKSAEKKNAEKQRDDLGAVLLALPLACCLLGACVSSQEDTTVEDPVGTGGPNAEYNQQSYQGQDYENQSYQNQDYSNQSGAEQSQAEQSQQQNNQSYNNQGYTQQYQDYDNQESQSQGYQNYGAPQQSYAQDSYDNTEQDTYAQQAPGYEEVAGEGTVYSNESPAANNLTFNAADTAPVTAAELQGAGGDVLPEEEYGASVEESAISPSPPSSQEYANVEVTFDDGSKAPAAAVPLYASEAEGAEFQPPTPLSQLAWVGYDYRPEEGVVRIEIVTRGSPQYSLYRTQSELPEIIVRLHHTVFRHRLARDIDASEFISPVSYIRVFNNPLSQSTDIILTLRELIPMRLYAKEGNLLATFTIPEKYYGNSSIGSVESAYAEPIQGPLFTEFLAATDFPEGFTPYDMTGDAFLDAPSHGGTEVITTAETTTVPGVPTSAHATPMDGAEQAPTTTAPASSAEEAQIPSYENNPAVEVEVISEMPPE